MFLLQSVYFSFYYFISAFYGTFAVEQLSWIPLTYQYALSHVTLNFFLFLFRDSF